MSSDEIVTLLTLAIEQHRAGRVGDARALYEQVLGLDPEHPVALHNLGLLVYGQGDLELAEACFNQALLSAPDYANAWNSMGTLCEALGRWDDAERCYTRTLELEPGHHRAHNNLGNVHKARGRLAQAIDCYLRALAIDPRQPAVYANLGNCYLELRELEQAELAYRRALELDPQGATYHNGLGTVYQAAHALDAAEASYRRAIGLEPGLAGAHNNLGVVRLEQGDFDGALACFETASRLAPDDLEARLNRSLSLPILYRTGEEIEASRQRFEAGLEALCADPAVGSDPRLADILVRRSNFYLQYQGRDDRALQARYGALLHNAVARTVAPFVAGPRSDRRLRVGWVSSFFREHTVGRLILGFLEQRDRTRFEAWTCYLGREIQPLTRRFQATSDVFRQLPRRLDTLVAQLRADDLDVVVFPEIGMEPVLAAVAAARVAPRQAVFWGHPVTTGLPTVDAFISCARMEPADGAAQYTEDLLELSGIGVCYARPELPVERRGRGHFGLEPDDVVFLSCQSLYKYLPQFDGIFPAIAARTPKSRFVFLSHPRAPQLTAIFQARLERAFDRFGLRWTDHCRFLPHLGREDYLELNRCADVFLDTPGWSGGNTTLEALACALPVVALPGSTMRSRHAFAMLGVLGLEACVAWSVDEYVRLASELGTDRERRRNVSDRIDARADAVLFNQVACVRELEAWFEEVPKRRG